MRAAIRRKYESFRQEKILLSLFIVVALIAVAGFLIVPFQERNRIRLVAEYQAYQFATLLLQETQYDTALDYEHVENLVAFGVYSFRGNPFFRTRLAPERVEDADVTEKVRFIRNRIRLLLRVGGGMPLRDGRMNRVDAPNRGMLGNQMISRYFYIEYAAPALAQRVSFISLVGVLASLFLVFAFVLIVILFRRLESYRAMESRNRELVALGEASRTLAHEIKNPLASILIRSRLMKKSFGEASFQDVQVIEEETNKIVKLVDRIREYLISGDSFEADANQSSTLPSMRRSHHEQS